MLRAFREQLETDPIEVNPNAELDIYLHRWRFHTLAYTVGGNEYVLWGEASEGGERVYSDRLHEQNSDRHRLATTIASNQKKPYTAAWYQLYLSVYFDCPVILKYLKGGLNEGNGYPYQVFGFQRNTDPNEISILAKAIHDYCEQKGISCESLPSVSPQRVTPVPVLEIPLVDSVLPVTLQPKSLITRRRLAGVLGAVILSTIDTAKR